jgi:hypothetical protein
MLKKPKKTTNKTLEFSMSKGKTENSIFRFLDKALPHFTKDLTTGLTQEDDISQECSIYLNREARHDLFMFHFQHKYPGKKRSSDFSVISAQKYSSKDPLIVIEAKRLPTPGNKRKREYVQGKLGAIERFKRAFHGEGLSKAAILGYIQKNTFDYWHKEVCSWINDLIKNNRDTSIAWTKKDLLHASGTRKNIAKYKSSNARINGKPILITHYWFYTLQESSRN